MSYYQDLFIGNDLLQNGDFCCIMYRNGGELTLPEGSNYPMWFVLSGKITMLFPDVTVSINSDFIIIFNSHKRPKIKCDPGTILLQYTPPERLSGYFALCCRTFDKRCTTPVPIRPELRKWINSLLQEIASKNVMDENVRFHYRKELARIIMNYPKTSLKEIYVPFYACSRIACINCRPQKKESDK